MSNETSLASQGRRFSAEERAELTSVAVSLYAVGANIRTVATDIGVSYGTARELLLSAGVGLRARGGSYQ